MTVRSQLLSEANDLFILYCMFVFSRLVSSKRLMLMSFECRSSAFCKLLFVSKYTFQYTYLVTTCPAWFFRWFINIGCFGDRDDGRCVRTSLRCVQLSVLFLSYC